MEAFYLYTERDDDGKWGFGEIENGRNYLENHLILGSSFDYVLTETLNLIVYIKDSLRGRDYVVNKIKPYFEKVTDWIIDCSEDYFWESENEECYIYFNRVHEIFEFIIDYGNVKFYMKIEKRTLISNLV